MSRRYRDQVQQLSFLTLPHQPDGSEELHRAQQRIAALEASLREAQAARVIAEASLRFLRDELQSLRSMPGAGAEALKRELIKMAHPDKWSQGQLATELAHELTVILTKTAKPRRS